MQISVKSERGLQCTNVFLWIYPGFGNLVEDFLAEITRIRTGEIKIRRRLPVLSLLLSISASYTTEQRSHTQAHLKTIVQNKRVHTLKVKKNKLVLNLILTRLLKCRYIYVYVCVSVNLKDIICLNGSWWLNSVSKLCCVGSRLRP